MQPIEDFWSLELNLVYPNKENLTKFIEKNGEKYKFLQNLFIFQENFSLEKQSPLLAEFSHILPNLEKINTIEDLDAKITEFLQKFLKDEPQLFLLGLIISLFNIILIENQLGPNQISEKEQKLYDPANIREILENYYSKCGEQIYKRTTCLLLIHMLELLLNSEYGKKLKTVNLWKARFAYFLNNLLSSNVPHLKDNSIDFYKSFIADFIKYENIKCFESEKGREYKIEPLKPNSTDILHLFGLINIEFSYCALTFYKYSLSEHCLETARNILGINHKLTGKLGKRTKYQQNVLSQLVLDIQSKTDLNKTEENKEKVKEPEKVNFDEESILFEKPMLVADNGTDPLLEQKMLNLYDQIYLNAFIRYMMLTRPQDQIMHETLYPYIEKTLEKSNSWIVFSYSLLLRSRNETDSIKRKERSLVQMQTLIDQYREKEPSPIDRFAYCFVSGYPLYWGLKKELARLYMNIGLFSSAYELLHDMELYEDSIQCLFLAGRKTEATAKAQEFLKKGGHEYPNILCLMADYATETTEGKVKQYKEAWEISKGKCPRALRSLGRLYYEMKKFAEAAESLETALKINTLYPGSWFTLGCTYLQLKNWEKAVYAFGWTVQVDENSSDGWSNLAVAYIQQNKLKEAINCYEQALKINRKSWKIWQNYILLSLETQDVPRVMGAIRQLIFLDMKEKVEIGILAKLIDVILSMDNTNIQVKQYEQQIIKLLNEMAHNDSQNIKLWELYADTYEILRVKTSKPENKKSEYLKLIDIYVKKSRSIMLNPNWDHFEYFFSSVLC